MCNIVKLPAVIIDVTEAELDDIPVFGIILN